MREYKNKNLSNFLYKFICYLQILFMLFTSEYIALRVSILHFIFVFLELVLVNIKFMKFRPQVKSSHTTLEMQKIV